MGQQEQDIDEDLLAELIKRQDNDNDDTHTDSGYDSSYYLEFDNKKYPLEDVQLAKGTTPVKKPTTRGGVYFSDITAYKITAVTRDLSLIPMISEFMLGPNTEFKELQIKTNIKKRDKLQRVSLICHLRNTMNNSEKLQLNLIVVRTKLG